MPMPSATARAAAPPGMGGYKSEKVTRFAGKKLTARMENGGPVMEYEFVDEGQLKWRYEGNANWREAWYEMYEPDDRALFLRAPAGRRVPALLRHGRAST